LGQGFSRKYEWPGKCEAGAIKFGVPTQGLESAKDMLYPMGGGSEVDPVIAAMYRNTHGNFAPGEQKNRNYDWKFDPTAH